MTDANLLVSFYLFPQCSLFLVVYFVLLVSDDSSRDSEVAPREHIGPGGSIQPREEKQEPVVVRPYPQVQMLTQHHPVQSAAPVTVTAPPAHLTPAVPLSFSDGLMKVTRRLTIRVGEKYNLYCKLRVLSKNKLHKKLPCFCFLSFSHVLLLGVRCLRGLAVPCDTLRTSQYHSIIFEGGVFCLSLKRRVIAISF